MAGPNIDRGAELFANGGLTKGKTKADDYVNGENAMGEHIKASWDNAALAAKNIPGLGLAASLLSGESAAAGLESEGLTGKTILPQGLLGMSNINGGFLARLAKQLLGNPTAGIGGDHLGEGSGELYTNQPGSGESATPISGLMDASFSNVEAPVISAAISRGDSGHGVG